MNKKNTTKKVTLGKVVDVIYVPPKCPMYVRVMQENGSILIQLAPDVNLFFEKGALKHVDIAPTKVFDPAGKSLPCYTKLVFGNRKVAQHASLTAKLTERDIDYLEKIFTSLKVKVTRHHSILASETV